MDKQSKKLKFKRLRVLSSSDEEDFRPTPKNVPSLKLIKPPIERLKSSNTWHRIEKEFSSLKKEVATCDNSVTQYFPTVGMFEKITGEMIDNITSMALKLQMIMRDKDNFEDTISIGGEDIVKEAEEEFKSMLKLRGKKFNEYFMFLYKSFGNAMNCVVLIFVEVVQRQVQINKKGGGSIGIPDIKYINSAKLLFYRMLKENTRNTFKHFFEQISDRIFYKLYLTAFNFSCSAKASGMYSPVSNSDLF